MCYPWRRCKSQPSDEMTPSSATPPDETRFRAKLRYRAWHRGMREVDLLLGRFADACLGEMSAEELEGFARLLALPDPLLYDWLRGRECPPAEARDAALERLLAFYEVGEPEDAART